MPLRELSLFLLVALMFAAGNVLARYMISHMGIPPLFYASMRYLIAAGALAHLIWPMPRPRGPLIAGTLLLGVFSFGLFYLALQTVDASSASVVGLSQSPMGVLLAMSLLGERASTQRILGIVLTLSGVALVIYRPDGFHGSLGLWIVLASSFCAALGSIICRKLVDISPLRIQAWSAVICFAVLAPISAAVEQGQLDAAIAAGWRFIAAVLFMGLIVSVVALTLFLRFLQRYDASLMAALNLLMPLFTVTLGVLLLGEPFDWRMIAGTILACIGVIVVTYRSSSGRSPDSAEHLPTG